jgi:hypothetical protein
MYQSGSPLDQAGGMIQRICMTRETRLRFHAQAMTGPQTPTLALVEQAFRDMVRKHGPQLLRETANHLFNRYVLRR